MVEENENKVPIAAGSWMHDGMPDVTAANSIDGEFGYLGDEIGIQTDIF